MGDYLSKTRAIVEEDDLRTSLIPQLTTPFYVEQDIYESQKDKYDLDSKRKHSPKKITIYDEIKKNKILLIEGGMGSGKSKLLRQLVKYYCTPDNFLETKIIPIMITYKQFVDDYNADVEKVTEIVNNETLDNGEEAAQYLILIDAIDEKNISIDEQIAEMQTHIININKSKSIRVIFTSRYLDGLDESDEVLNQIVRFELRPMSFKRIIEFLTYICKELNIADRILEDLKSSQLFKELPHNPISAILLARLLNENSKDLPSNLTELYKKYMELMLGRWEIDKGLQSQKEYTALHDIMMNMARYMIENELPSIAIDEAKDMFNKYLQARNMGIKTNDLFEKMKSRCEIIMFDISKNCLSFKHRTFSEYYYAESLLAQDDIVIDNRVFSLYWMNVFFFYLGIKKGDKKTLQKILDLDTNSEPERWLKIINMSNYFLASYAVEFDVIEKGLKNVVLEASNLYKGIIDGEVSSPFSQMSRMSVLYIMQFIIRHNYSFEYFIPAFETAALMIDDEKEIEDDVKAYSIFFLNVAYIELGKGQTFDFLLTRYARELPLDLALAVQHESENIKERTLLMKKQDKRINKKLKGNVPLIHAIEDFYKKPILKKV